MRCGCGPGQRRPVWSRIRFLSRASQFSSSGNRGGRETDVNHQNSNQTSIKTTLKLLLSIRHWQQEKAHVHWSGQGLLIKVLLIHYKKLQHENIWNPASQIEKSNNNNKKKNRCAWDVLGADKTNHQIASPHLAWINRQCNPLALRLSFTPLITSVGRGREKKAAPVHQCLTFILLVLFIFLLILVFVGAEGAVWQAVDADYLLWRDTHTH